MTQPRLSRAAAGRRAAAPVRLVHLGLGNFFRAHQCWYTEHAADAPEWGIAAFTGRKESPLLRRLNEQDGLYTLVVRSRDRDGFEPIGSLSRAYPAAAHEAWLACFADPALAAVTVTVTEAGWLRGAPGGLDADRPQVRADIEALRRDPAAPVVSAPARLVAGIDARRRAGGGSFAIVPCDNTPGNGKLAERVVQELAELVDPGLAAWARERVAIVTTMVDRITPRTTDEDLVAVREATGFDDRCAVVTEPFSEWVLSGAFPAGRPGWEDAGATFTGDVTPFEQRKLWLLNGAHSLLAYGGSIRGHETTPEALADEACRSWLDGWWSVASPHLPQPEAELAAYREALLERFANTRLRDRLERIAEDGSQKLPIRIVPVLVAERAAGRLPAAATRVIAAWVCHLRGLGAPVSDARAGEIVPLAAGPLTDAVPRVLSLLAPGLAEDGDVVSLVLEQCVELAGAGPTCRGR